MARRALRCLPRVHPVHDIAQWACISGCSYFRLLVAIKAELNLRPSEVSLLFVLSQARVSDDEGVARGELAIALGYSDPSCLAHALQRARSLRTRLEFAPSLAG